MIRMICGVYGGKDGLKRAGSGPFCLSEKEEARLVRRGVAVYVNVEDALNMCGLPQLDDMPGADDAIDINNNRFTEESLMKLTRENMEKLAADMGIDVSGCRTKADIAKILAVTKAQADEDDYGELPELAPEGPVL